MGVSVRVACAFALLAVLGGAARAQQCNIATCSAMSSVTPCRTLRYQCVDEDVLCEPEEIIRINGQGVASANPAIQPGGCVSVCELVIDTTAAAGTACTTDNLACTSDICDGAGNCTHVAMAGIECSGTCVTSGCCANPNSCPGGAVCPANGSPCGCPSGQKACNGGCIPTASCCLDSDCPSDEANNRHGVCGTAGCAYACDTNYKACGATCIPSTQCCSAADCTAPPNGCYKVPGTCSNGSCSYVYNDGAACNADNTLCTPNDTCMSGMCIADTAHTVVCVQRACHSASSCDPSSGNCVDTAVTDGTVCGGDGCLPAGTCTTGTCSTAGQAIDCSGFNATCQTGVCDPNRAGTGTQKCTTVNSANNVVCSTSDLCQQNTVCSGGSCLGTQKSCAPSGPCDTAACNAATGSCVQTLAAAGSSCIAGGGCSQNATCDANGNCNGDPVPDGTPCSQGGCATGSAACVSGACTCLSRPGDPTPTSTPDMGTAPVSPAHKHGCSFSPGSSNSGSALILCGLGLAFAFSQRRRHARAISRRL